MTLNHVAITGMGLISPIGLSLGEAVRSLHAATSGIRLHQAPPIEKPFAAGAIPVSFEEHFGKLERPFLDRCQHMAILAAREAISEAGLDDFSGYGPRAGLYYANVNGGTATGLQWFEQLLVHHKGVSRPFTAMAIMSNAGGAQVAIRHKIHGPVITNASACASSGVSIGEAARAIADGYIDVAVAGGGEAALTSLVLGTFDGTRAMSRPDPEDVARTCKPFSGRRTGLVLGEGAAFVVLENAEKARARGARIHGYMTGYGISCDAHHIGMPESNGQIAALQAALAHAGIAPGDVGYINAHATATQGGDVIEATSIAHVFGEGPATPPVSSTKSVHGHLLGGTSALEFVLTVLAMGEELLPASAHLGDVDERCAALNHVGERPVTGVRVDHALSFSCGFGGTNVALVASRHPKP